MSEIDDLASKEQASTSQEQELLRNVHHRIAADGTLDFNMLQYIQGIAATVAAAFVKAPNLVSVVENTTVDLMPLILGLPGIQIVVFDILLSINAPTVVRLTDGVGNNVLAPMYAPNAGQGYTMNSVRGKRLPWETGLFVQSTNAVGYGIDVSYCTLER